MEIKEIDRTVLADGVVRFHFTMPSSNFYYLGYFLESLEGLCTYTNPPARKDLMQIDVVPDLIDDFLEVIKDIKNLNF